MTIIDKQTGEIIGTVAANQSLTFDRAMELAGFEWKTLEDDGVECDGWYDSGGTLWDESTAEVVTDMSIAAAALGKIGGKSTSKAKAAAARENGRKGGRPGGA